MTESTNPTKPFFATWRVSLDLTPMQFWPRYGVSAGAGVRFERSVRNMPRVLMLLIALHRLDCLTGADFAWLGSIKDGGDEGLGRDCACMRKQSGLSQKAFWARFGIAQPTGGRYERGAGMLPAARRLLSLYRAGRLDDADLACAGQWLRDQRLPLDNVKAVAGDARMARPDDLYGIRWMNSGQRGEAGYLVVVKRRGHSLSQWFGVARFGSTLKALAAAQCWRDEILNSVPPMTKREFVAKVRRNNTSGVAGVSRLLRSYLNASGTKVEYAVWEARPPRCLSGVSGRSFRVSEFGEDGAKARAIALRKAFELQVEGVHAPNVPLSLLGE